MTAHKPLHLVPQLRFAEFSEEGAWEEMTIGNMGEVITGSTPSTSRRDFYGGDFMFVSPADISELRFVEETKTTLTEAGFAECRPVKKNSVLFVCIGSIGKVAQCSRPCATNQQINSLVTSPAFVADFAYYLLDRESVRIGSFAGKQVVPIINKGLFATVKVTAPAFAEQQKIADCLGSLDDLIAAEGRKLDALRQHKQGLMQQLFPQPGETVPQLRFPEFVDEPPWECFLLKKLAKRITKRNTNSVELRALTNSAEHGVVDQREYFNKDIASNTDNYYIVETGDYVYNSRISSAAPVGPISKNHVGTGVMSPLYTIFRFWSDANDFFAHYFSSSHWHGYLRRVSNRGARYDRMAITNDDLMRMPIPTPSPREQQKIADCLGSLDDLIAAEGRKLDALRQHKQGLMQQLFPSLDGQ